MIEAMTISGVFIKEFDHKKSWSWHRPMISRADIVEILGPEDDMKMSEEEFFRRAVKRLDAEGWNVENAVIHRVERI